MEELMTDFISTQQAISDIEFLKKAISNSQNENHINPISIDTHLILNGISFGLAASALAFEISGGGITTDILASKTLPDLQVTGLLNVAIFLISIIIGVYAILKSRAKKEKSTLKEFASHNFIYYKNFSILADVLIKFLMFSLIILAGKPEWIAAILVLFTGDLVIHGRHFYLPLLHSFVTSALCFGIAVLMLCYSIPNIGISLGIFTFINGMSLFNILRIRNKYMRG